MVLGVAAARPEGATVLATERNILLWLRRSLIAIIVLCNHMVVSSAIKILAQMINLASRLVLHAVVALRGDEVTHLHGLLLL